MQVLATEVSRSKDNIYLIYLKLDSKRYNVEHYNDDAEDEVTTLTIYLEDMYTEKYVGNIELDVSYIWNKFEFPKYDIRKYKEEIYIYVYSYPYEDSEVEWLDIDVKPRCIMKKDTQCQ